ncbi:hypothetical protein BSKO_09618 [Bryopsis sp. KO-2023]|nr:hypothetical protein BSKO_09618 [Bryopsis sp. KO-2023]
MMGKGKKISTGQFDYSQPLAKSIVFFCTHFFFLFLNGRFHPGFLAPLFPNECKISRGLHIFIVEMPSFAVCWHSLVVLFFFWAIQRLIEFFLGLLGHRDVPFVPTGSWFFNVVLGAASGSLPPPSSHRTCFWLFFLGGGGVFHISG